MKRSQNEALAIGAVVSAITIYYLNSRRKRPLHQYGANDKDHTTTTTTQQQPEQQPEQQQGLADDQIPSHILRERHKEKRRQFKLALLSMKSPMYDNIDMVDPQGTLLCKVSARKAKWYISKELADWVEGEGVDRDHCLQLRFEPKKRGDSDTNNNNTADDVGGADGAAIGSSSEGDTSALYAKAPKQNVCVSCGEAQNLVRHYIIPYAYRALMPLKYKSHMSHDIVILCCYCNIHCEKARRQRIEEIEEIFKPPQGYKPQFENDQRLYKVRSAAVALKKWAGRMPMEKVREHEMMVMDYLQEREGVLLVGDDGADHQVQQRQHPDNLDDVKQLSSTDLQRAIDVKYRVENTNFVSSHQVVVSAIVESGEEGVSDFVKGWRRHFLDTVQPQYMPVGWSVDNSVACDS
eukprot:CAMPEP_0198253032 /NCGR_PEP_ID=MMETSP1447-20131203/3502_1 /TAXON_ID=420782 /ORGANISM="Chaetoceros dichaeta, Strain CCMP1751" /LENGTH=406 /DNA_ID=CAMNT_0043938521 /DNA_START=84 /DNA_END=1304 /DNA_ORIENTATION=+